MVIEKFNGKKRLTTVFHCVKMWWRKNFFGPESWDIPDVCIIVGKGGQRWGSMGIILSSCNRHNIITTSSHYYHI